MKGLVLVLFFILAVAQGAGAERFKIGGNWFEFARHPSRAGVLSYGCGGARAHCQALGQAKISNGKPGALACKRQGGRVLIGADPEGNELAFCAFPDQSMVSVSSMLTFDKR